MYIKCNQGFLWFSHVFPTIELGENAFVFQTSYGPLFFLGELCVSCEGHIQP